MNGDSTDFQKTGDLVIRKVLENIDYPYVWMPLGLFVLCVLAYPITNFEIFLYLSIGFLLITFVADWTGRWKNRQIKKDPPELNLEDKNSNRNEIYKYLTDVQMQAVSMLKQGKRSAAQDLTQKSLAIVDEALKSYPSDPDLHAIMGYALKDAYQSSKGLLPESQRQSYLGQARASFEHALRLEPNNASAHNGLGNILFFEGQFDKAIEEMDRAIELSGGKYASAEHDKQIVIRVKKGEYPFDF